MSRLDSIGTPTPLIDGYAKVTGATQFLPDLNFPGLLHARLVTSMYPHARVKAINSNAALEVPGIVAVLTANDLPDVEPNNRFSLLLARERVIFVGQPIAVVIAISEAAAYDGVDRVTVDYEPLSAAVTIEQAISEDAQLVWPDGVPGASDDAGAHGASTEDTKSNYAKHGNIASHNLFQRGDVERGLDEADVVVERIFETQAVHQSYLETHGIVAQPDQSNGGIKIWTSTQSIFDVSERVSQLLQIPESDVHVVGTPIGGAFGGKFPIYEGLIALAARQIGKPVRLVLTRKEDMLSTSPMLPSRTQLALGALADGTLTAVRGKVEFDTGCLPSGLGSFMGQMLGNIYRVPNLELQAEEILTFKPSCGAYRAPGAPQAAFVVESLIDEVANKLGIDPLEIRRRNAVRPGDLKTNGEEWSQMAMIEVLDAVESHPAWTERESSRANGYGVGMAIGAWQGGTGPAAASCTLGRDGKLIVQVGAVDMTGTSTTLAMVASEGFGIDTDAVKVVVGDTTTAPFSGASAGSKITYTVGPAVLQAAKEARKQALEIAAEEFEANVDDLYISDGNVGVRGVPDAKIALSEIASKSMNWGSKYAPVLGYGRYAETGIAPVFCAQIAEVEVNRETGHVFVKRLVVVQDVGRALNPIAVQGQMMGGAAQGLGWALYENLRHDSAGQLVAGSWMDYTVPHAHQVADVVETVLVEEPSEYGPFGARGVGEPPIIATAAAVANAIADATGVFQVELPMTAPTVLAALNKALSST